MNSIDTLRQDIAEKLVADITGNLAVMEPLEFYRWLADRNYRDACKIANAARRMQQDTPDKYGMTRTDQMAAYEALKTRYNLKHQQRSKLDEAPHYGVIVGYAHKGDWAAVESYLKEDGII